MSTKLAILASLALAGSASAQLTLVANTPNSNGLTAGTPALFFDLMAGPSDLAVTHLSTGSDRVQGATFEIEVRTYAGSCLGGPVASGPGSSPAGWTTLGVATGTQGVLLNGMSLPIDIPNIVVRAGHTVGVALVYVQGGVRYLGLGLTPAQVFSDVNLTLTTGDARSEPFTTEGAWFQSRALQGALTYVLTGSVGSSFCGPAVPNSTGAPGTIRATGSQLVAANELTLVAESLPASAFGFFLTSTTQGHLPFPGGSQGVLCILGSIGRYVGPGQVRSSGPNGTFDLQLDLTRTPTPLGLVPITAGESWHFTTWHRDSVGGAAVSNFTDALTVSFL